MEKIYKLLDYLTIDQAVQWLQVITRTKLSGNDLLDLCESRQCVVYMNVDGVSGWDIDAVGDHEVMGSGIQKVLKPTALKYAGTETTLDIIFEGPVFIENEPGDEAYWTMWEGRALLADRYALFQPADIQALGAKINGGDQPQDSDIEKLRQLCHREQTAKKDAEYEVYVAKHHLKEALSAVSQLREQLDKVTLSRQDLQHRIDEAETELKKLRHQSGNSGLDDLRQMLKAKDELSALASRAEAAESMVETLDSQLRDLADKKRSDDAVFQALVAKFRSTHKDGKSGDLGVISERCLTFPYATKQLEAMRDAALAHWVEHDRSKPAPYGIQKTVATFLAARTGENARKLAELAAAIKPDDLPKA
ncbi:MULTISPECIES: hypothetical protein [Pseudomonas]|uniref:hypothetical protein n=1 Tax=Pseudomonas TaxID=286 RepID=UPI0006D472A6|nr:MULTISPECIES: hypothetical protein [Pseudomonas]